ncbi:putative monovalent cation/H+ antiporter subunit E [Cupriavidus basilensis OR16]|uniref:Putative monovalent cation/H+ antiporter subunit E n=1 Tax=Cupriavidus basilensis OR16 TaxID=1127483 RepID=H1RZ09_9BURK|nr:Na+/H+ antiporter subunit E [Cupriavidus basilensis]EHP44540.1 putative monovalent cation/H+ antiporter subunit E [Cupriavidus basilensis OR16]
MAKRLFPHPWLSLALLAMWLLLTNSASPGNLALGAFLGWAISLRIGARLWLRPMRLSRPDLMLRLAAHVLIDIVVANVEVAILVLGPVSRMRPTFIQVPIDVEHELALSALISIVSLSPGTLCAELSDDRRRLLVHVLDLDDETKLIALIKTRYEAPLREIFECLPS